MATDALNPPLLSMQSANPVSVFARHRVACNLLMALMLFMGVWGLMKLNTQFFPNFSLDFITIGVVWTGASAEDIELAIVNPLEQQLRTLDNIKQMTSTASEGGASVVLEYIEGSDMAHALNSVKDQVSLVRNLPSGADDPVVSRVINYEPIASLLVSGTNNLSELRTIVRQIERELLTEGVAKITISGLPKEEIAIQVSASLRELNLSLPQIAQRIAQNSRDFPAGTVGRDEIGLQLRALNQRRDVIAFEELTLISDKQGQRLTLGDVATIKRRAKENQTQVLHNGLPAVELKLLRSKGADSLESAAILERWLQQQRPKLPRNIEIQVFDEAWKLIVDRITLLLKNGLGGLILVVLILFVFLNGRVAFWIAVGIPVSFMAALGMLYMVGGSINMISLFALIMTLGIIVDDAIVVGEEALSHYQSGGTPSQAAEHGALRMLAPVLSSSLTTIAAFLPLMLIGGIIGNILFDIPLIVICVIVASLVESFLVLPGHLRHALTGVNKTKPNRVRRAFDNGFLFIRERLFRPLLRWNVHNPWITIASALSLLVLAIGLIAGGRVPFVFFPTPEGTLIYANLSFVAGTPRREADDYLKHVHAALMEVEAESGETFIKTALQKRGALHSDDARAHHYGAQHASLVVELFDPDQRRIRTPQIIAAWQRKLRPIAGIENLILRERRSGPPGSDIDLRLLGDDPQALKQAALDLADALSAVPGVTSVSDDMPFGQQQLIYELTPQGKALGLTVEEVGRQVRAAYDGHIAQIFQHNGAEIEVRVVLPDSERHYLSSLDRMTIALPSGHRVALLSVVRLYAKRGFQILRHTDGRLSVLISADLDTARTSSDEVIAALTNSRTEHDHKPPVARLSLGEWVRLQLAPAAQESDTAPTTSDNPIARFKRWLLAFLPNQSSAIQQPPLHRQTDGDPAANPALGNAAAPPPLLEQLRRQYDVDYSFEGRRQDQSQTLTDMRNGGILALVIIYIVLAWVFASYSWPLAVMSAIPLGLIGAIGGHWLMGIELTILSLFGVFGLSGIVVNDSIILIVAYKKLLEHSDLGYRDIIVEAGCRRLRAVLLTSLTTIGGLTPLLFETSLQAQFLIPMAVSISFGLAFATLLVLVVVPALLTVYEGIHYALGGARPKAQPLPLTP